MPAEKLLLCDKRDRGFHIFCLKPILALVPKGSWFCPSCSDVKKPKNGRKRRKGLVMTKKRRKMLPFIPTEDSERRLEQIASLATATKATGMEKFSDELTYVKGLAPKSAS